MSARHNPRALGAFHAIVEAGAVTAAARKLGLSQPTVSRMLSDFERDIGFQLFYRDRGRLVLTADGVLLHEENCRSMGAIARVSDLIDDIAEFRTGELRLVAPPSLCENVLPDIAASFLARMPGVRLSIDSRSFETSRTMIANRTVDGGFLKLPLGRDDLTAVPLIESQSVCVMAATHDLAAHATLTPALLGRSPLILLGLGHSSRLQIEASFAEIGLKPNVRVETHTIGSACALAARGIGITIVNSLLAQPYLKDALIVRELSPRLPQNYAFATPAGSPPSRLAAAFLTDCHSYVATLA